MQICREAKSGNRSEIDIYLVQFSERILLAYPMEYEGIVQRTIWTVMW